MRARQCGVWPVTERPALPRSGQPVGNRSSPIRWGLPDAALCWLAGLIGAAMGSAGLAASGIPTASVPPVYVFGVLLPAQNLATAFMAWSVSRRKGLGSLRRDFGLAGRFEPGGVLLGMVLQVALSLATAPLIWLAGREGAGQELIRLADNSKGAPLVALIVVQSVIVAPVVEELLFRGVLLRSLLRRTTPTCATFVSGALFGAIHLIDPRALAAVPGLVALGILLAWMTLRTGNLSRAISVHAGFNLLAMLFALT